MMPTDPHRHLDDETLNALLDDEASEQERADVDACPHCSGRLERLHLVASALAEPGPPPDADRRRAVIDTALRAGAPELTLAPAPTSRRRQWMSPAWAAAAAVVVAGALAVPLVDRLGGTDDRQETATAARDADDSCPGCGSADDGSSAGGDVARTDQQASLDPDAAPVPVAPARERNLGAIDPTGLDALLASLRRDLQRDPALDLAAPDDAPAAEATRPGALAEPDGTRAPAAGQPCEEPARRRDGALGPVAYAAEATVDGRPVVVLAFEVALPDGSSVLRLLVLATGDCAELGSA